MIRTISGFEIKWLHFKTFHAISCNSFHAVVYWPQTLVHEVILGFYALGRPTMKYRSDVGLQHKRVKCQPFSTKIF